MRLANGLLNVSEVDMGAFIVSPIPTDLRKAIDNVFAELTPQVAEKQLKVKKKYSRDLPLINIDQNLFMIIMQNLLVNAIKYTAQKGKVNIELVNNSNEIIIKISDNGYGIPQNQQSKIFDKLFRSDNVVQKVSDGAGLGLYIVKAIIGQSGGRIWFHSTEGKGTTFYVAFPLSGMKQRPGLKKLK